MGYSALGESFLAAIEGIGTAAEVAAPYVGAGAVGAGVGAAASSGGATVAPTSAASTTGPSTSANPGGSATAPPEPPKPGFFGNAVKAALVGGAVNSGTQLLMGGRKGITVPPPPGAAMIDPEGAQAAAQLRARQAVAGGLGSTITGAGANPPAFATATSGGKSLLGQ